MACWITVTLDDGTEQDINLDHFWRIKRQKNDGKKTILFDVTDALHPTWCTETVEEIRKKREEQN
jgi:hypothetical protein